jgi:hypothetical protein
MLARNHRNTARFGKNKKAEKTTRQRVKIHYKFHPLFNQQVEVIFSCTKGNEKLFLISFIDKTHIFLPTWMTDPLICQNHIVRQQPVCSLAALLSLRAFLDQF